ncbi:MAG: hypothetical protein JSU94_06135 [Phycisphaerales bacterium]|nr:MAG: hypothetical protein JSU94_06135 [Phycisphaerales bacterium]
MRVKIKRFRWLLPTLAILSLLALGATQTAIADEYDEDLETDTYVDDPDDIFTSTEIEDGDASAYANEGGYVSCSADAYTWATDGAGASTNPSAWASWKKTWEWDGSPENAPGGTLSWSLDGDGFAESWGGVDVGNNGGGLSVGDADSSTYSGSTGSSAYGIANAFGYVQNQEYATATASISASVTPNPNRQTVEKYYGSYYASIRWGIYDSSDDNIASGTTYIYFYGKASCECLSASGAGPSGAGAEASTDVNANADANVTASFTSN